MNQAIRPVVGPLAMACLFAVLVFAGSGGCVKSADPAARDGQATEGQKPAHGDDQILAEVKRVFAADPLLKGEPIAVSVRDGRVYLEGQVSSGEVRIRAEDKARSVPEVFGVDSEKLTVL